LASTVFEAYGRGVPNAIRIVDDSAKALAYLLNQGVSLYGVRTTAVASGGLFEHYGEIMAAHIRKYSEVELIISDLPPVYGACRNACKLAGQNMHPDFAVNFKNTYAGGSV
jgi:N-acetylglucosamine kinase-like BadF-type ATPase